jgi:hypothetical protein
MLTKVTKGPYPKDRIAVAHTMLCYLYKKRFTQDAVLENLICVLLFGDLASSGGPLTHCIVTTVVLFAPLKNMEPYNNFKAL